MCSLRSYVVYLYDKKPYLDQPFLIITRYHCLISQIFPCFFLRQKHCVHRYCDNKMLSRWCFYYTVHFVLDESKYRHVKLIVALQALYCAVYCRLRSDCSPLQLSIFLNLTLHIELCECNSCTNEYTCLPYQATHARTGCYFFFSWGEVSSSLNNYN